MGAVTFSLDPRLMGCLKQALPLTHFVETGTFRGDAVALAAPYFERIVSIEHSHPLWREAAERFRDMRHVEIRHGDSAQMLKDVRAAIGSASALFWLDAHWCVARDTAGEKSQCPLLGELGALAPLGADSVVLIDDARLFLATPPAPHEASQWPSFAEVLHALRAASATHQLMVVNDVIAFFPAAAQPALAAFAAEHGIDWLRAAQSLDENTALRRAIDEKEAALQALHATAQGALRAHEAAAGEAQRRLRENEAAIGAFGQAIELASQQHALLARTLEEKANAAAELEKLVGTQHARAALVQELHAKEAVIGELSRALGAYRAAFRVLNVLIGPARAARRLLQPRLGILNQHEPLPLALPRTFVPQAGARPLPRISLVTPSFRQADFIERTIRSVLAQEYPNLEYFVQDGGSTDGTVDVLQRYADRLAGYDSRPDSGQSEAINRGFARTQGEIMGWLNSDDILLPGALACVADFFQRHPDVDAVYGHRVLIDENDREIGRWVMPAHDDAVLSWADYVPQETLFWRRRIWDKAGGRIDESFRFAMDWDLLVRFREAGARFARLPRFIGGFRIHPHQKTSAAISQIGFEEMNRIRERVLGRVPSSLEVRKAVVPYLLRHVATDLAWRVRRRLGTAR